MSRSTAHCPAWSSSQSTCSLPLTVNRYSPKCILILGYILNELSESVRVRARVCARVSLCMYVWVGLYVCVCVCAFNTVQARPGISTVFSFKVYYSTMYFIEKIHKGYISVKKKAICLIQGMFVT